MAIIKKFRIKSFKNVNSIIEFENISLAYGNRLILDNLNFKINEVHVTNANPQWNTFRNFFLRKRQS